MLIYVTEQTWTPLPHIPSQANYHFFFSLIAHVDSEKQNPKDLLAFPLKKSSQFP